MYETAQPEGELEMLCQYLEETCNVKLEIIGNQKCSFTYNKESKTCKITIISLDTASTVDYRNNTSPSPDEH